MICNAMKILVKYIGPKQVLWSNVLTSAHAKEIERAKESVDYIAGNTIIQQPIIYHMV